MTISKKTIRYNTWREAFAGFKNPRVIGMLFLGFSAGIPILLIFSTMSVWLREAGVDRATIGFFSWAALGYAFKFIWAPLIDRVIIPYLTNALGRRRSWLIASQTSIALSLILIGTTDPSESLELMATFAIFLGFSSATQDIVIDAYRIEAVNVNVQGLMSSSYIAGYRLGMLVAGAGALELVSFFEASQGYSFAAWSRTYFVMACLMIVGIITTICIKEPKFKHPIGSEGLEARDQFRFLMCFMLSVAAFIFAFIMTSDYVEEIKEYLMTQHMMEEIMCGFMVEAIRFCFAALIGGFVGHILISMQIAPKKLFKSSYIGPILDFFQRYGKYGLWILVLIGSYRISDIVMGVIANVFYFDMGFDKQVIGRITKGFGLTMTILGGFLGGLLIIRYGVMKTLFLGAFLAAMSNVFFIALARLGDNIEMLSIVIAMDNLSAGVAAAAFVAYLSSLTNRAFTASQYAIFSSLMLLFPKLLAGYSGVFVESLGYEGFFFLTALLGLPVLILVVLIAKFSPENRIG